MPLPLSEATDTSSKNAAPEVWVENARPGRTDHRHQSDGLPWRSSNTTPERPSRVRVR